MPDSILNFFNDCWQMLAGPVYDAILGFFILCWQMLTSSTWWSLLVESIIFNATPDNIIALSAILTGCILIALALCYALLRGMHKVFWPRPHFCILSGFFALLAGVLATLAFSSQLTAKRAMVSSLNQWEKVMAENPGCWSGNPIRDYEEKLRNLNPEAASTLTRKGNCTCVRRELPPADNSERLRACGRALASMATDALCKDYPALAPFIRIDCGALASMFAEASDEYWNKQDFSPDKSREISSLTRMYNAETLAPFVYNSVLRAREAACTVATDITIFISLLALLALLVALTAIFYDLDWQIRHRL